MPSALRAGAALAGLALLAACVRLVPESLPPNPDIAATSPSSEEEVIAAAPAPETAAQAGLSAGPQVTSLGLSERDAAGALASFVESCPKLLARGDVSGITRAVDWRSACDAASDWPTGRAPAFFAEYFETIRVGDGTAFATGYFEPEIAGSRTRSAEYNVPIYAVPRTLTRAWPADTPKSERTGRPPLGRVNLNAEYELFYERSEIVAGALMPSGWNAQYDATQADVSNAMNGQAEIIAWAADPIEFFFLQIQGSGLLRLQDGSLMRIGYAGQNGREYVAIGRPMRERGLIGEGTDYPLSMQGIVAWLRDNPDQADEIMNLNKSWIFFRELDTDGPLGALEVPVRAGNSIATDPKFVPLGAPVWLDMERDEADGLWIAQDTGGAIKGANRFDTFWGNGARAREIAGGMASNGTAVILVPRGTISRLGLQ